MKQKQDKKQKMTLDKLAQMTADGFGVIDKKFEKIDERFDRVENSITDLRITMDKRLNSVEEKTEKNMNKILIAADGMTKQFSDWKQENAFGAGIAQRQDEHRTYALEYF